MKWPYSFNMIESMQAFYERLKQLFSDVGSDMQEQKTRVDNLINGVEQPSEVVDMHLGRDGQTYPVARDMVLGEIGKTESAQAAINADTAAQLAEEAQQRKDADTAFESNKADQIYVDQVLAVVSNGGPNEIFYSISALNAAYPSGAPRTKIVFDSLFTDGAHSMLWNGTSWQDVGVYQGQGVPDGSVKQSSLSSDVQSDLYRISTLNLYNPSKALFGQVDSYNVMTSSTTRKYTDPIPVISGDTLWFTSDGLPTQVRYVTPLKADGTSAATGQIGYITNYVIPDGVVNVIISFDVASNPKFAISKGSPLNPYEPYYISKVSDNKIAIQSVESGIGLNSETLTPDLIKGHSTLNLFNPDTAQDGMAVSKFNISTKTFNTYAMAAHMVSNVVKISKSKKIYVSNVFAQAAGNGSYDIVCADLSLTKQLYRMSFNTPDSELVFTLHNPDANSVYEYAEIDFSGVSELPDKFLAVFNTVSKGTRQFYIYNDDILPSDFIPFNQASLDWLVPADKSVGLKSFSDDIISESGLGGWRGKNWVSFGDSFTGQNKWQPTVASALGLNSINHGYGGYPVAVVDNSNPGYSLGSGYILSTIASDLATADIVTVMGGINDWGYDGSGDKSTYNAINIGDTSYPFDLKTFKGALSNIIYYLSTNYPNLRIVVMSPPDTRGSAAGQNDTTKLVNALGLTSYDFAKAAKDVADYYGCYFIDLYGESGINNFNHAIFSDDGIHPNDAGAKKMAEIIIRKIGQILKLI